MHLGYILYHGATNGIMGMFKSLNGQVIGMDLNRWNDILTLLAMLVLADHRIYKEELDAFTSTVEHINLQVRPDIIVTHTMAFDWFIHNREQIRNRLNDARTDQTLTDLIKRTRSLPGKASILKAMVEIAKTDQHFHNDDKHMLRKVATGWNIRL